MGPASRGAVTRPIGACLCSCSRRDDHAPTHPSPHQQRDARMVRGEWPAADRGLVRKRARAAAGRRHPALPRGMPVPRAPKAASQLSSAPCRPCGFALRAAPCAPAAAGATAAGWPLASTSKSNTSRSALKDASGWPMWAGCTAGRRQGEGRGGRSSCPVRVCCSAFGIRTGRKHASFLATATPLFSRPPGLLPLQPLLLPPLPRGRWAHAPAPPGLPSRGSGAGRRPPAARRRDCGSAGARRWRWLPSPCWPRCWVGPPRLHPPAACTRAPRQSSRRAAADARLQGGRERSDVPACLPACLRHTLHMQHAMQQALAQFKARRQRSSARPPTCQAATAQAALQHGQAIHGGSCTA